MFSFAWYVDLQDNVQQPDMLKCYVYQIKIDVKLYFLQINKSVKTLPFNEWCVASPRHHMN